MAPFLHGDVSFVFGVFREVSKDMKSKPLSGPDIGGTLARVQRRGITWLAILAPLTLIYLAVVFYFAREVQGASHLLRLPPASAEALLVDLAVATALMIVAITLYLRLLAQRRTQQREAFVAAHEPANLVHLPQYPALVYAREGEQLRILWNADGVVEGGALYCVPHDITLRSFDAAYFIARGTP